MSLIIAKKIATSNTFIIMGDTKLTDVVKKTTEHPKDGVIKSIIINSQLCISYAGEVYFATEALMEIGIGTQHKNCIIDILKKYNHKSQQSTDFICCFGNPYFELIQIKDGKANIVDNCWIGSYNGFKLYQSFFINHKSTNNISADTSIRIVELLNDFDEEENKLYSDMFNCMSEVINDPSIEEVGGFIVPIAYHNTSFEYKSYTFSFRSAIDSIELNDIFKNGQSVPINLLEGACKGGYCVNFISSNISKVAIYLYQGNQGYVYERKDYKLMYPTLYLECDEIDFFDTIRAEHNLFSSYTFLHNIINFKEKGINEFNCGNFSKAIEFFDRAIKMASTNWGVQLNNNKQFKNLSDFLLEIGQAKIKIEDANHLKIVFFNRGLSYFCIGEINLALLDFRQVIAIDKDHKDALINKGICEFKLNRINEAIGTLNECVKKYPSVETYFKRGSIFFNSGDLAKARSDFKLALNIDPHDILSKTCIAEMILKLN